MRYRLYVQAEAAPAGHRVDSAPLTGENFLRHVDQYPLLTTGETASRTRWYRTLALAYVDLLGVAKPP